MVANYKAQPPKTSIYREGIRIHTGTFITSPVESLHAEAYDSPWSYEGTNYG